MYVNKLICLSLYNVKNTDKFKNLFFKVYTDEDYKVLVNLKGKEDEDEQRKIYIDRIAKERREGNLNDDNGSKTSMSVKKNDKNDNERTKL